MARLSEQIDAVVAARNFGIATAVKRGRNPRWPYVPVIDLRTGFAKQYGHTEQIRKRAYATREEAIACAQKAIDARREHLRQELARPECRALREQCGLPREIEAPATPSQRKAA